MKTLESGAPVSALRRKLMLGFPGGLALSTPLALLGCGGGGSGATEPPPAGGDDDDAAIAALAASLPAVTRVATAVAVALPAGSGVLPASTNVVTTHNVSPVSAEGNAGAILLSGTPQLAYVFDAAGRLLLLGVIEPGVNIALDSRTSAEALILIASEAGYQGEVLELALRETLRTHPLVEPVRMAVEAAASRGGIDDADADLMTALEAAVRTLRGDPTAAPGKSGRKNAQGVEVLPAGAQSGITVEPTAEYNTIQVRNDFRRRTHVWISKIGTFDAAGNPTKLTPAVPIKDFALDGTTAFSFDSVVISAADYLAELAEDIGFLGAYERGNGWWNPVHSKPLVLEIEPSPATVTVYRTRVVGIGVTDGEPFIGDEATKLEEILGTTFFKDIFLPVFKTLILPWISTKISKSYEDDFKSLMNQLLLSALGDLTKIEISGKYFPETVAALRNGNAGEVMFLFVKELGQSSTFKKVLETALKAILAAAPVELLPVVRDAAGNIIPLPPKELIDANVAKLTAAFKKLTRILAVVKLATTVGDYGAMAKDWLSSSRTNEFTLNVSGAKISLSPDPVLLDGVAVSAAVTAKVEGVDASLTAENIFLEWKCSAKYGDLYRRGGGGKNTFESPLISPAHDYVPNGDESDPAAPDIIEVTAFYRNTTTAERIKMGSAKVTVKFKKAFNLAMSPGLMTIFPSDNEMDFTAFFQEKLPAGATVAWEWSHAGVGSISAPPPNTNPADSKVLFKSGSSEGSTTITARATIDAPAADGKPPAIIIADPVSITFNVRKGLKTIEFEAHGGVYGCTDPLACGVSEYTAFLVSRVPNAVLYKAVLSGYAYPGCNRTVTWNSVKGDGGDCNFPVTYYPHSSAGATNTWAVWIGFGGPMSGKCMVTVTLTQ